MENKPSVDRQKLIDEIIKLKAINQELDARKYLKDLFEFNRKILKVEEGSNGKALPLAPFHKEMCSFIEKERLHPGQKDQKMLLVPRSHLKSTIGTVGYCLLRIAKDPTVRILIANATYDMACAFLGQIKKHLQYNETFRDYYGDFTTNAARWSENMITIPKYNNFKKKEATVTAYGMGGNLVSQHYDVIIGDDLINRDYISTPEQIQKTIMFYKDALDLLEPDGMFLIFGTRWHDADLYGWIMDKTNTEAVHKDFDVMIRQAYTGNLETGDDLELLFPQKFSKETLQSLKRAKGITEFYSQYMNDPLPAENAKFKQEWFKTILDDDLKHRELNFFTMVDPAIGQRKTSDKTAIVTIAVDQYNNWSIVNIIWDRMLPNQIIDHIFVNYETYYPKKIGIELTAYQKSLQYAIIDEMRRRSIFIPIVELKAERSKQERIEGLIPRYANSAVYHLENLTHRDALEDQLLRYPVAKHDDIIDALAYGLQISIPARKNQVKRSRRHVSTDEEDRPKRRYLY